MVSKSVVLVWESKIHDVPFTMVSSKTKLDSKKRKNDASCKESGVDEFLFHRWMPRIRTKSDPWLVRCFGQCRTPSEAVVSVAEQSAARLVNPARTCPYSRHATRGPGLPFGQYNSRLQAIRYRFP